MQYLRRDLCWLLLLQLGGLIPFVKGGFFQTNTNTVTTGNSRYDSFFFVDVAQPLLFYQSMDSNSNTSSAQQRGNFEYAFRRLLQNLAYTYRNDEERSMGFMVPKLKEEMAYKYDLQSYITHDHLLKHAEYVICDFFGLSFALSAMDRNADAWLFSSEFENQNMTAIDESIVRSIDTGHRNTRFFHIMMHPTLLPYFDWFYQSCVEEKIFFLLNNM